MRTKYLVPILFAVIFTTGFSSKQKNSKLINLEKNNSKPVLLGMGWDSHSESSKGFCVENAENQVYYAGSQTATLNFDRRMSLDQLESDLDVKVSGKLKIPAFEVKGAAHFLSKATSTKLSDALVFSNIIRGKNAILKSTKITEAGQKAAEKAANEAYVREQCGDGFVSEIELGAKLFVGVKFDFSSKEAKSKFDADIKVDYLSLFDVSGAAKVALKQFKNQLMVQIFVFQQGGDAQRASDILNDKDGKGSSFIRCKVDDTGSCLKALENLVRYISSDDPDSFKNQIKDFSYDPTKPGGPAFITHASRTYYSAGHNELYPVEGPMLDTMIQNARKDIIFQYQVQNKYYENATTFLAMRLTEEERARIEKTAKILKKNLNTIVESAVFCYAKPNGCLEKYKNMNLSSYDPKTIYHVSNFLDYCDTPAFSGPVKDTVASIKKATNTTMDSCDKTFEIVRNSFKLNLSRSEPPITDLSPLTGLENLEYLDLEDNKISFIKPLEKFKNLKEVFLRNNLVQNTNFLSNLPELEYLDVSTNDVVKADAFENHSSLKTFLLFDNDLKVDPEPLKKIPTLEILIFSKQARCAEEADNAFNEGIAHKKTVEYYKKINHAPWYNTPGDIKSGILTWSKCITVFNHYDPGHGRLDF